MTESHGGNARAIVDTGPLVAFFDADDEHHAWSESAFRRLRAPLLTCEPVLAETLYLLRASPKAPDTILEWIARGTLGVEFELSAETAAVRRLMRRYRNVPMSLADACLVRMSELRAGFAVCTLDSNFRVYRKDGGAEIPVVMPDDR